MYLGRCFAVCQLHLLSGGEPVKVLNPHDCWVKKAKGLGKKILIDTDSSVVMIMGKGVGEEKRVKRGKMMMEGDLEW